MRKKPPPDNPFPTKAEDVLNKGLRAGVGALPVIGSTLTEFWPSSSVTRRKSGGMISCERRWSALSSWNLKFDQLDKEALRDNEQFQATFIQATRLSTQAASDEKRKLLQNAIINSAILGIEENQRQLLMQFLERVTPLHAALLNLFDNPRANEAAAQSRKRRWVAS